MANMSYCRFENTAGDLEDCLEHIHNNDLNKYEAEARTKLINLCCDILEELGMSVDFDQNIVNELEGE